jgi:hypothetical protein
VVIGFPPDADLDDAVRAAVAGGAVRDRNGQGTPPGATSVRAEGATAVPDLVDVTPVPATDTLWDFRFDEPVASARADLFVLVRGDARPSLGTSTGALLTTSSASSSQVPMTPPTSTSWASRWPALSPA